MRGKPRESVVQKAQYRWNYHNVNSTMGCIIPVDNNRGIIRDYEKMRNAAYSTGFGAATRDNLNNLCAVFSCL